MSDGTNQPDPGLSGEASSNASYRVLARKYRPATFDDLIGQDAMVRTVSNAFEAARIPQAWILTGVRGVGKTTTARILARALNYELPDGSITGPTIKMPVLGQHCQAIMESRHIDVIEMDAASHNSVDDIRQINDAIRYAPVSARYKVYILDEVHMLSTQAFNALLKTLEEPPPHAKFIFATTEIRKVPITILSRCQRFDLRRVDAGVLTAHLEKIAGLEGVTVEPSALAMVARAAEGSVRDALSILDQAIAHGEGAVTGEEVRAMLGLSDRARVVDLFELLMKGDVAGALNEFRAQYDAGADPAVVLTDLAEFTHLVTRLRFVPEAARDASLTEDERTRGAAFAGQLPVRVLSRAWQMLLKGIGEVDGAARPASAAEMVLIRIAHAATLPTLDEALKALDGDGAMPSAGNGAARSSASAAPSQPAPSQPAPASAVGSSRMPSGGGGGQTMRLVERRDDVVPATEPQARMSEMAAEQEAAPAVRIHSLADIAALADAERDLAFKVLVKRCVRPVRLEPGRLDISLTADAPKTLAGDLNARLRKWTGRNWLVTVSREEGGPTLAEQEASRRESAIMDARADPNVAAILARFPGAKIVDVRLPDAVEPEAAAEPPGGPAPDDTDDNEED
jgi:DNA polymerase-3 subunit gamma/tau